MGSQLPYIKWARENGYAVIVANTNINTAEMSLKNKKKKEPVKIRVSFRTEADLSGMENKFATANDTLRGKKKYGLYELSYFIIFPA